MTPRDIRGLRFCVIDDSLAQRRAIADTLRAFGARTVFEDGSAECALARIDIASPDIVVLDWYMPGMDGQAYLIALDRMIPEERRPQVLVATALPTPALVVSARSLGVRGIIRKPFAPQTLLAKLLALPCPRGAPLPSGGKQSC